jgi:hypothetical protein
MLKFKDENDLARWLDHSAKGRRFLRLLVSPVVAVQTTNRVDLYGNKGRVFLKKVVLPTTPPIKSQEILAEELCDNAIGPSILREAPHFLGEVNCISWSPEDVYWKQMEYDFFRSLRGKSPINILSR